jgi:predicted acyltransferase
MAAQGNLLDFDLSRLSLYCNTLQAIGAGYLIAGLIMLNVGVVMQIATTALLLLVYWALLMWVPVADLGTGVLQPDANVALAVDQYLLGSFRAQNSYTWILSSMGFGATVLLGVLSGHVLRSRLTPWLRVAALTAIGVGCLAGGWIWDHWLGLPIIKHIWTSSMVLWAGGWSFLLLALFYLVIDVLNFRRLAFPFIVIGMNAITIYMAHHFISFNDIADGLVGGLASHLGDAGPALIAFTTMSLVWLLLYHMYRHKIFLRI